MINMAKWVFKIDGSVHPDIKRDLQKKHYIIKEPFADISVHEMHIDALVADLIEVGLKIVITPSNNQIYCTPE